ncbi:MAG: hypothetical protein ABFS86_03865, partial [Planctomycetota bacterium]
MSRDRLPDASVLKAMGTAVLLLALAFLAGCHAPERGDLGCDSLEMRVTTSDRLAEEPWVAHVAVGDEGVRARLDYEPADGGPRERFLPYCAELPVPAELACRERVSRTIETVRGLRRTALVLHARPDQAFRSVLRRMPADDFNEVPRLFLADLDGRAIPFFLPPPHVELSIQRLGRALQYRDMEGGVHPDAVVYIRIARRGGRVRYRWGPPPSAADAGSWGDGDVTLDDAEVRMGGGASILPGLAGALSVRDQRHAVTCASLFASEDTLFIDVLRAVECAKSDPKVLFFPGGGVLFWTQRWSGHDAIRVPRADRELHVRTSPIGPHGTPDPLILGITPDGRTMVRFRACLPDDLLQRIGSYADKDRPPADEKRIVLHFDGRAPWAWARTALKRASATGIELALPFQHGDAGLDLPSELRLPGKPEGERLPMKAAEAGTRAKEARGRV